MYPRSTACTRSWGWLLLLMSLALTDWRSFRVRRSSQKCLSTEVCAYCRCLGIGTTYESTEKEPRMHLGLNALLKTCLHLRMLCTYGLTTASINIFERWSLCMLRPHSHNNGAFQWKYQSAPNITAAPQPWPLILYLTSNLAYSPTQKIEDSQSKSKFWEICKKHILESQSEPSGYPASLFRYILTTY